jgi:hypothetical protein
VASQFAQPKTKCLLLLKISEFIWGYDEELACITEPDAKQADQDHADQDLWQEADFWPEPETPAKTWPPKRKFVKPRNFRRPDGRCMFGVLAERNDTWWPFHESPFGPKSCSSTILPF